MFLGFGHKRKTIFGDVKTCCKECGSDLGMKLERITSWNSFCFLPIFDFEHIYLTCPECQHSIEIKETEEYYKMRYEIDFAKACDASGIIEPLNYDDMLKKYKRNAFLRKNIFKIIISILIILVIIYDQFIADIIF